MSSKPLSRLLVDYSPKVTDARDLKDDYAVIVVEDANAKEDGYYLAGLQRCLNDPERLKGPAIINRAFKRLI